MSKKYDNVIEKQLLRIKEIAEEHLDKSPEYLGMLIDEIDIKLSDIESAETDEDDYSGDIDDFEGLDPIIEE